MPGNRFPLGVGLFARAMPGLFHRVFNGLAETRTVKCRGSVACDGGEPRHVTA